MQTSRGSSVNMRIYPEYSERETQMGNRVPQFVVNARASRKNDVASLGINITARAIIISFLSHVWIMPFASSAPKQNRYQYCVSIIKAIFKFDFTQINVFVHEIFLTLSRHDAVYGVAASLACGRYDMETLSALLVLCAGNHDHQSPKYVDNITAGGTISNRQLPRRHWWRHNERDSVSNHRRLDCLLNRLFVQAQIKENTKAPRHWPLWGEFPWWAVDSPHKGPVTREMFPFNNVMDFQELTVWSPTPYIVSLRTNYERS